MNHEWAELAKAMQVQLKKEETFGRSIETTLALRTELMKQMSEFKNTLSKDEFYAIPFINVSGYHSKTIAYSLYHIFRIEDIVANSLIKKCNQIFFENNYQSRMNSPIITTGNELAKQEIADFSRRINIDELYNYMEAVNESSTVLLKSLPFADMKKRMTGQDAERLRALRVVSGHEKAFWLIDFWCAKNIRGLIQMPFSRHWIMHIEACLRIKSKILQSRT